MTGRLLAQTMSTVKLFWIAPAMPSLDDQKEQLLCDRLAAEGSVHCAASQTYVAQHERLDWLAC